MVQNLTIVGRLRQVRTLQLLQLITKGPYMVVLKTLKQHNESMTFLEKVLIAIAALAFMLITGIAKRKDKSITPKEFVSNVAEVLSKVGNWLTVK